MATLSAARAQPAAVSPTAEPAPVPRGPIETLSVLLRFGAVMAVVLAAASLPASSLIGVRRVVVVGARTVSAADIVSRSGIRPGDRLLGISTARAAARVRTLPRVARAEVSIGLGGAVTIHVAERRPYAVVALRGRYLLLDASGVVIDTAPAAGRPLRASVRPCSWRKRRQNPQAARPPRRVRPLDTFPQSCNPRSPWAAVSNAIGRSGF